MIALCSAFAVPLTNKFQTGFDQPLLCGMYAERRLTGIQAVHMLSRINRADPGIGTTYALGFVNRENEILGAFREYYAMAELECVRKSAKRYFVNDAR